MRNPKRKIAFVLAATEHGTMIVNRLDYRMVGQQGAGIGVGFQILEQAMFDPGEVDLARSLGAISATAWWRSIAAPISGFTPSSGRSG